MDQKSNSEIPLGSIARGDGPPLYDDVIDKSPSSPLKTSIPGGRHQSTTKAYLPFYVNKTIAEEPHALYRLICEQAQLPPRLLLHVAGSEWKGAPTTDFKFTIDLTSTVLRLNSNNGEWSELKVVRDGDGVEAYRGGWATSLKWEHGFHLGGLRTKKDLENRYRELEDQSLLGLNENGSNEEASSLMAWCERFCRDPAGIKTFTFHRKLGGFDYESLRSEVAWYLRSMNYDGDLSITFDISNTSLKVYSPHWYNHLRETTSFQIVIFVTQLWIILLPLFAYLEGRYGIVRSVWWSSRTVQDPAAPSGFNKIYAHDRNEVKIADLWSPAIIRAIKDRENSGRVLNLDYLERLQERAQERMANVGPFLPERDAAGSSTARAA